MSFNKAELSAKMVNAGFSSGRLSNYYINACNCFHNLGLNIAGDSPLNKAVFDIRSSLHALLWLNIEEDGNVLEEKWISANKAWGTLNQNSEEFCAAVEKTFKKPEEKKAILTQLSIMQDVYGLDTQGLINKIDPEWKAQWAVQRQERSEKYQSEIGKTYIKKNGKKDMKLTPYQELRKKLLYDTITDKLKNPKESANYERRYIGCRQFMNGLDRVKRKLGDSAKDTTDKINVVLNSLKQMYDVKLREESPGIWYNYYQQFCDNTDLFADPTFLKCALSFKKDIGFGENAKNLYFHLDSLDKDWSFRIPENLNKTIRDTADSIKEDEIDDDQKYMTQDDIINVHEQSMNIYLFVRNDQVNYRGIAAGTYVIQSAVQKQEKITFDEYKSRAAALAENARFQNEMRYMCDREVGIGLRDAADFVKAMDAERSPEKDAKLAKSLQEHMNILMTGRGKSEEMQNLRECTIAAIEYLKRPEDACYSVRMRERLLLKVQNAAAQYKEAKRGEKETIANRAWRPKEGYRRNCFNAADALEYCIKDAARDFKVYPEGKKPLELHASETVLVTNMKDPNQWIEHINSLGIDIPKEPENSTKKKQIISDIRESALNLLAARKYQNLNQEQRNSYAAMRAIYYDKEDAAFEMVRTEIENSKQFKELVKPLKSSGWEAAIQLRREMVKDNGAHFLRMYENPKLAKSEDPYVKTAIKALKAQNKSLDHLKEFDVQKKAPTVKSM